jgi:toxin secretion/phage lysis holin
MEKIKIAIIGFFAVVSSWLGTLAIPVYILVACNVIDYVTGITSACVRKEEVSSYKGIMGIAKKVFMYLLIVIGVFVDFMLQYMFNNLNIPISLPFIVGCIVACWLVLNEMLSILENLNEIGVPMPPFLMPLVERIKGTVEKKGDDVKDSIGNKEESADDEGR